MARAASVIVWSAAALGGLAVIGAAALWFHYGTAVFFEMIAAGIAAYHFVLIRKRSREGCFRAFNHNNWFGGAVFLGLLLEYWVP